VKRSPPHRDCPAPSEIPSQLFTEERDCDEKGCNNRPDNRRAYNGVGRQTGSAEALTTSQPSRLPGG
jgi:hypothetical protein